MKYIRPLTEIRKNDIPMAGGKGANLGEMVSVGIPVPDGGVLIASAYDLFIRENDIPVGTVFEDNVSPKAASEILRSRIMAGTIPETVVNEIRRFYASLGENARVAVRSSATAEDLEDASFAGQQETYLNIQSEDAVLERIKACYASLWGERAIYYRNASGYGQENVSLAVVIQQMVESDFAGVLFTRDPAGNPDDILINAAYGLGEAVVSGIVSPDEYVMDRAGNMRRMVIGSKAVKIVYDKTGTVKVPVPEGERSKRVLNDKTINLLLPLALRIEALYGHPMDIEWAVKDGSVFILQARAITTAHKALDFTEKDFEGLPVPRPATGRMRENILFNLEKVPKPYFPLDHDFGDLVGKQKEKLLAEAGIRMNEMIPINDDGISAFTLGGIRPTWKVVKMPALLRGMKDENGNRKMSAAELATCTECYRQECRKVPGTIQEVGESLERLRYLVERTSYARFRYAIFPQVLENIGLNRMLKRMEGSINSFDLLEGLSYVTADINREMAGIAADIRRDPMQTEAVMTQSYTQIVSRYPELGERFSRFMERFGNRSDLNCYCFVAKSWNDEPDRFLHSLRTILRGGDKGTPSIEESRLKFEGIMASAKSTLGPGYAKFESKVEAVRHYHYIREATQYLWESIFAQCRKLLHLGAEMLGESYHDLLYLFADEFFAVCRNGHLDEADRARIRRRKEKRPLAEAYWNRSISIMLDTGSTEIRGVCGSNGKATGKACLISGPQEFSRLEAGDILVCPYTDPEWTPLFTLAAGVVVDTGGTLSHAAIVAREYRIPAVLATGNATGRIHDGDLIMVDGDSGKVVIL